MSDALKPFDFGPMTDADLRFVQNEPSVPAPYIVDQHARPVTDPWPGNEDH